MDERDQSAEIRKYIASSLKDKMGIMDIAKMLTSQFGITVSEALGHITQYVNDTAEQQKMKQEVA